VKYSRPIALGDAELYLGWGFERAGITELRLGLIFPAGYDTRDGDPWMGTGNVQVTLGAALNPNITRYSRRWEISTEWKWAYALDDAIAKSGSWGFFPSGSPKPGGWVFRSINAIPGMANHSNNGPVSSNTWLTVVVLGR
jgi:hypothetical protein